MYYLMSGSLEGQTAEPMAAQLWSSEKYVCQALLSKTDRCDQLTINLHLSPVKLYSKTDNRLPLS